jgi:hypothetical protein
LLFVNPS